MNKFFCLLPRSLRTGWCSKPGFLKKPAIKTNKSSPHTIFFSFLTCHASVTFVLSHDCDNHNLVPVCVPMQWPIGNRNEPESPFTFHISSITCNLSPITWHLTPDTWPPLYAGSPAIKVLEGLGMQLLEVWWLKDYNNIFFPPAHFQKSSTS